MTEVPAPRQRRWLSSIDLLRGVAALAVAMHHLNGAFWRSSAQVFEGGAGEFFSTRPVGEFVMLPIAGFGFLGVPLFFVISGFCIHMPLAGGEKPLAIGQFAVRRFFRLYPLYLAVCVGVFLMMQLTAGGGRREATVGNFVGHLFFWHYNVPDKNSAMMGISPVLWSVAVEVHFYIMYALLLPVLRRVGFGRCAVIGLAVDVAYRVWWASLGPDHGGLHAGWAPFHFAPARFGEWLLGAWIAEAYVRGTLGSGLVPSPRARFALGWAVIVVAIPAVVALAVDRYWLDVPVTVGFALILAGMAAAEQRDGPPAPSLFWRVAKWLGDRSYSLYLVHFTVIAVCVDLAGRVLGLRTPEQKNEMGGKPLMLLAVIVAIPAVLIVTDLAYRLIELPTHRLGRRLGGGGKGKAAAAE